MTREEGWGRGKRDSRKKGEGKKREVGERMIQMKGKERRGRERMRKEGIKIGFWNVADKREKRRVLRKN